LYTFTNQDSNADDAKDNDQYHPLPPQRQPRIDHLNPTNTAMTHHTHKPTTPWIQATFTPVFQAVDCLVAAIDGLSTAINKLSASLIPINPSNPMPLDLTLPKMPQLHLSWHFNLLLLHSQKP